MYLNAFFDPVNLDNPITHFPDTSLYQEIVEEVKKVFIIDLRRETVTLDDSLWGFFSQSEKKNFYEVKNTNAFVGRFDKHDG